MQFLPEIGIYEFLINAIGLNELKEKEISKEEFNKRPWSGSIKDTPIVYKLKENTKKRVSSVVKNPFNKKNKKKQKLIESKTETKVEEEEYSEKELEEYKKYLDELVKSKPKKKTTKEFIDEMFLKEDEAKLEREKAERTIEEYEKSRKEFDELMKKDDYKDYREITEILDKNKDFKVSKEQSDTTKSIFDESKSMKESMKEEDLEALLEILGKDKDFKENKHLKYILGKTEEQNKVIPEDYEHIMYKKPIKLYEKEDFELTPYFELPKKKEFDFDEFIKSITPDKTEEELNEIELNKLEKMDPTQEIKYEEKDKILTEKEYEELSKLVPYYIRQEKKDDFDFDAFLASIAPDKTEEELNEIELNKLEKMDPTQEIKYEEKSKVYKVDDYSRGALTTEKKNYKFVDKPMQYIELNTYKQPIPLKAFEVVNDVIDKVGDIAKTGVELSVLTAIPIVGGIKLTKNIFDDSKNLLDIEKKQLFKKMPKDSNVGDINKIANSFLKNLEKDPKFALEKLANDYDKKDIERIVKAASSTAFDTSEDVRKWLQSPKFLEVLDSNYKVLGKEENYTKKKWKNISKPDFSKIKIPEEFNKDNTYNTQANSTTTPSTTTPSPTTSPLIERAKQTIFGSAPTPIPKSATEAENREVKEQEYVKFQNELEKPGQLTVEKLIKLAEMGEELGYKRKEGELKKYLEKSAERLMRNAKAESTRGIFGVPTQKDTRFDLNEKLNNLKGEKNPVLEVMEPFKAQSTIEDAERIKSQIADLAEKSGRSINEQIDITNDYLKQRPVNLKKEGEYYREALPKDISTLSDPIFSVPMSEFYQSYKGHSNTLPGTPRYFTKLPDAPPPIPEKGYNEKEIEFGIENGIKMPGHQKIIENTAPNQIPAVTPLNYAREPVLPATQVIYEAGKNVLMDAGNIAGAALAYNTFGPQGAYIYSSIYNNFLKEMVNQNQPYRQVAGDISRQLTSQGIAAYQNYVNTGRGSPLVTPEQERKDFIDGRTSMKRGREDETPSERLVHQRSEFNPLTFEATAINPLATVYDGTTLISPIVSEAFLQRNSGNLVRQSQEDYNSWFRNQAPYAI